MNQTPTIEFILRRAFIFVVGKKYLSLDNYGPFTIGEHVVTLTVTDSFDESDLCQAIVTVVDNLAPVPDAAVLPTVTGECSATITTYPTAADNCVGTITGTTTDPLTYTNQETYTVTWFYDDGRGNVATQEQTVIVTRNLPVPELKQAEIPDKI
jgi:hypothetical protein